MLSPPSILRPLSKAPNPQLLPERSRCVVTVYVCVHYCVCVCVHLDGLNAEHKFRVWVTILGHTSLHIHLFFHLAKNIFSAFLFSSLIAHLLKTILAILRLIYVKEWRIMDSRSCIIIPFRFNQDTDGSSTSQQQQNIKLQTLSVKLPRCNLKILIDSFEDTVTVSSPPHIRFHLHFHFQNTQTLLASLLYPYPSLTNHPYPYQITDWRNTPGFSLSCIFIFSICLFYFC